MGISEREIQQIVMRQKKQKRKWDAVAKHYSEMNNREEFLKLSFNEVMEKYEELFGE